MMLLENFQRLKLDLHKKNLEIEYLRAVAILMTLLCHFPAVIYSDYFVKLFLIYSPWTGVDLFFCISGYVISKSYMDFFDRYRNSCFWESFQVFWLKRAYRLIPVAWLWLLIHLVLACCFNSTHVFGSIYENIRSMTAVMTFWANLANVKGILEPHPVYWSLALEEQFYLIFPLFLFFTVKNARWKILLAGIMVQFFILRLPKELAWCFRLDAMLWGVLIYLFSQANLYHLFNPTFLKNSFLKKAIIVIFLLYLLGAIPAQLTALPIAVGLIAMTSAFLVWLASYQAGYIPFVPILSPIMEWFGARSYSLYLIHMPAYRITMEAWTRYAHLHHEEISGTYIPALIVTAIFLTCFLAELSYQLIEQPFRRHGAKLAKQKLAKMDSKEVKFQLMNELPAMKLDNV
ncbi:acyltransferase [Legionella beliardensis]|uniref:Acyltransferase n=1 Tax=Legionella beliardensis TaxID=91822 RepID=A0A378I631_9GAMM|nr:acyltransferase [Legionella beliardensis]STX30196.1 acyltransferase [Legionella beliardensis]